jgi:hypothetical protein
MISKEISENKKYCSNCKHCRIKHKEGYSEAVYECEHPQNISGTDLVSGKYILKYPCHVLRRNTLSICGEEGKLHEPRLWHNTNYTENFTKQTQAQPNRRVTLANTTVEDLI